MGVVMKEKDSAGGGNCTKKKLLQFKHGSEISFVSNPIMNYFNTKR